MPERWSAEEVLETTRGFQQACVLMAGAELDVFGVLGDEALTAGELAEKIETDRRATEMLADALAAMGLLSKQDDRYTLCPGMGEALTEVGKDSVLAMVRHLANCMRSWGQLGQVVRSGKAAEREPSVRGAAGDLESFIEAMNDISRSMADGLVEALGPLEFEHLLCKRRSNSVPPGGVIMYHPAPI